MKEIFKITLSLTVVCVVASVILGAVFAKTEKVRKENKEKEEAEIVQSLLGYGHDKKAPEDLKVYAVYRYVIKDAKGGTLLGYLLPLKEKGYVLAEIDLTGKPGKIYPVDADAAKVAERTTRDEAINAVLPQGAKATYAQTLYIADVGGKRLGYVVEGRTPGFKTFIELMVSLNPEFNLNGIAIVKHEEDPGLGAEIVQDYFKNQFKDKPLDVVKNLKVVKEPIPDDYLVFLEPAKRQKSGLSEDQLSEIKGKHLKDDIYALTGATISTRALTTGVVDTVRKFVYRIDILKDAIQKENIQVAF